MKKFIIKAAILMLAISLFVFVLWEISGNACIKYLGMDTEEQIDNSFKNAVAQDYNCYFLGNSRIYRGINPDKIDGADAYNFAFDNDSYIQMYYKLLYLMESKESIEKLVIGTDYFMFSFLSGDKNYAYEDHLPEEYLAEFGQTKGNLYDKWDSLLTRWAFRRTRLKECADYLRGVPAPVDVNYQKGNGQFVVYGTANGTETIHRDYSILETQLKYYNEIILLCEKEKIELYVIMPPLWSGETESHTDEERKVIDDMIIKSLKGTPYEGRYYNYYRMEGLSEYTDFMDVSHLNVEAADRYSAYIDALLFGGKGVQG